MAPASNRRVAYSLVEPSHVRVLISLTGGIDVKLSSLLARLQDYDATSYRIHNGRVLVIDQKRSDDSATVWIDATRWTERELADYAPKRRKRKEKAQ